MIDELAPTAAYYRKTAEEIRGLASKVQLPDVRREMLELAERFDRMAAYVEQHHPDRRGGCPPASDRDDT